jgi:diphthine synthase
MGELAFVGLGLGDEAGLSARQLAVLRAAGRVFAEEYTAVPPGGTWDRLAAEIDRPIERLDRAALESEAPILTALTSHSHVALVVPGDPFAATTHVALRIAAERAGHTWRYLPNASVVTAAPGFLGLMQYRFGRTVSLPFPAPGFEPRSPLEQIAANRSAGLHTLVLLDLRPEEGRYLTGGEALRILRDRDPAGAVVGGMTPVAIVARVGRDDAAAAFGPLDDLVRLDLGPPPHCLVVPAELHFEEAAALATWRHGPSPAPP